MSPYYKKQKVKRRKNLFRKWHRRIGFTAALFLINLAVTGILLNHSESLNLHNKYIENEWLIQWYGINPPTDARCYQSNLNESPICQLGEKIFYSNNLLIETASELIGLSEYQGMIFLASSEKIIIYDAQFNLIDEFSSRTGLPTPLDAIGLVKSNTNHSTPSHDNAISITVNGKNYLLDFEQNIWAASEIGMIDGEKQIAIKDEQLEILQTLYLQKQISLLKLVQDLHSGRLLPEVGKWATDLVGIILILLAMSGFMAWQKRKNT